MSKDEPQSTLGVDTSKQQDEEDDCIGDNQSSLVASIEERSSEQLSNQTCDSQTSNTEVSSDETDERKEQAGEENLEPFGIEDDNRPNSSRLDNPDGNLEQDRRTNVQRESDEPTQEKLFPDVEDENQLTLGGDKAYNQCQFG